MVSNWVQKNSDTQANAVHFLTYFSPTKLKKTLRYSDFSSSRKPCISKSYCILSRCFAAEFLDESYADLIKRQQEVVTFFFALNAGERYNAIRNQMFAFMQPRNDSYIT